MIEDKVISNLVLTGVEFNMISELSDYLEYDYSHNDIIRWCIRDCYENLCKLSRYQKDRLKNFIQDNDLDCKEFYGF